MQVVGSVCMVRSLVVIVVVVDSNVCSHRQSDFFLRVDCLFAIVNGGILRLYVVTTHTHRTRCRLLLGVVSRPA